MVKQVIAMYSVFLDCSIREYQSVYNTQELLTHLTVIHQPQYASGIKW